MCSVVLVLNVVFNMCISNFIWTIVANEAHFWQMKSLCAHETIKFTGLSYRNNQWITASMFLRFRNSCMSSKFFNRVYSLLRLLLFDTVLFLSLVVKMHVLTSLCSCLKSVQKVILEKKLLMTFWNCSSGRTIFRPLTHFNGYFVIFLCGLSDFFVCVDKDKCIFKLILK